MNKLNRAKTPCTLVFFSTAQVTEYFMYTPWSYHISTLHGGLTVEAFLIKPFNHFPGDLFCNEQSQRDDLFLHYTTNRVHVRGMTDRNQRSIENQKKTQNNEMSERVVFRKFCQMIFY